MLRIDYTNLSKAQVENILAEGIVPKCTAQCCSRLSGQSLKIILDKHPVEGPELYYEFQSDSVLSLRENGGSPVSCNYAAYTLSGVTLFSHMITGTKRGYTAIVNWETSVVTVYEMWFIDHEGTVVDTSKKFYDYDNIAELGNYVNREVQRQYYFGYFETPGKEAPTTRDRISLKLENRMIKWDEDRGRSGLTTYTSTTYSTFVELGTPDGGDVITFVSDILQINDHMFIYCYGEVEYSGRLGIEVIDLFTNKKIGATLGIDEKDKFDYTLYNGCGKNLGRYATFFDFNDVGDKYSNFITDNLDYSVKGARATYRPSIMAKKITKEELAEAAKNALIFSRTAKNLMVSDQTLPETDYCVGKTLTFRADDGFAVSYEFTGSEELKYRCGTASEWHTEEYHATMLDDELVVLGHYQSTTEIPSCLVLALDFKNGLATCIEAVLCGKYDVHDVDPIYHFGVIEAEGITPLRIFRHGFTDELLGCAFTQTYSDEMSSIHIYNAPHSYSWTIINHAGAGTPANRAGGPVWSSPCEYIKLRDDVYIMNWVESKWEGLMGFLCRNLKTGRDCGFDFGVSHDGKNIFLDKMGALSRSAGRIDLSGIFPLHSYNPRA